MLLSGVRRARKTPPLTTVADHTVHALSRLRHDLSRYRGTTRAARRAGAMRSLPCGVRRERPRHRARRAAQRRGRRPDELAAGRPTITLRSAAALEPVDERPAQPEASPSTSAREPDLAGRRARPEPEPSPVDERGAELDPRRSTSAARAGPSPNVSIADDALSEASIGDARPEADAPIDVRALDRASHFEWKPRKPLRERPRTLYGAAIVLLLIAFAAQACSNIATRSPRMRR